jgi:diacylglycerol kinase (ATP)
MDARGSAPIVVIANPTAGGGKAGKRIGRVDAALRELRVDHEVRVTESPSEMEAAARAAAEEGARVVAVLGGDGTVSCAANGMLGSQAALAVLPAGTGDDFARSLGARTLDVATRLLANPKIRRIDMVRATTPSGVRHFVNVAGAGFDSEVNETANTMTARLGGTGTYLEVHAGQLRGDGGRTGLGG